MEALKGVEYAESTIQNMMNRIVKFIDIRRNKITYDYFGIVRHDPYNDYIPVGGEFDIYTAQLASELRQYYPEGTTEHLLTVLYDDNEAPDGNPVDFFDEIQAGKYKETLLANEYYRELESVLMKPELHYAGIAGVWIPTGDLSNLGVHPEIGFQVGMKHMRMNYDLIMAFRFLNSPNTYLAKRKGSDVFEETKHFFGGHIGLDVGFDVYRYKKNEFQLLGGIAWDGFDALKENPDWGLKHASASSFNINFGAGYRFYLSKTLYIGLRAKYHIVDYTANNVVTLKGKPVTIQFVIGGFGKSARYYGLNRLRYKYRE